jgi:hypothetical protein
MRAAGPSLDYVYRWLRRWIPASAKLSYKEIESDGTPREHVDSIDRFIVRNCRIEYHTTYFPPTLATGSLRHVQLIDVAPRFLQPGEIGPKFPTIAIVMRYGVFRFSYDVGGGWSGPAAQLPFGDDFSARRILAMLSRVISRCEPIGSVFEVTDSLR